ncbi:hypothetical protein BAY61_32220 (plasmid) [Prauserella marina]|uniref:Uncharacterized protein n=1 Tax=Prauserella marina TaxID=530584 RepID=A0A222W1E6_9PSEU|nr:DUF4913 domain-containing protein [Prauserella marina]ASR39950.1 hypothetical protein BAY61_32220 [Prauserella marina]PWV71286.1 uncharacterized protein DUF4913 [Prauserella marina]SDD97342.1 protein of unknown function [Prauserella marina]
MTDHDTDHDTEADSGTSFQTYFPDLSTWVTDWLLLVWQHRQTPSQVWCPQWWQHTEVISRFEGMWRSWELARLDNAAGMAAWWRDVADHHMPVITDTDGPFHHCRTGHNKDSATKLLLTGEPPPPGWFAPEPTSASSDTWT